MYKIEALPAALAARFVASAPTVVVSDSERSGPCRFCLRDSSVGERLALGPYSPFDNVTPYGESGPIFVHADGCERFSGRELPANYRVRKLVLRAYDERDWIADAKVAEAGEFDSAARELFADPRIRYVHVRHLAYGCFAFRLERERTPVQVTPD